MRAIDVHAHAVSKSYVEGLHALGIDPVAAEGFPVPSWSADEHLRFMDEAQIEVAVLSPSSPHINAGDDALACKVARAVDEENGALCAAHPDRFRFAACLPLPSVEGSLDELAYAMDVLGAIGVKVPTNACGVYLGDARLDPVFEELERRCALVVIHPSPAPAIPGGLLTSRLVPMFEFPVDTTRAVINLIVNDVPRRYPHVRIIVPHVGSFIPYMRQRIKGIMQVLVARGVMDAVDVDANLAKLYFDIAGDPEPDQLGMLLAVADPSQLLYGSDYPYTPAPIACARKRHLEEGERHGSLAGQIFWDNAQKLLG